MLVQTTSKLFNPIGTDRDARGVRVPAKLLKQIRASRQTIQQVIGLDAPAGAVRYVTINGQHHTRPIQSLGYLRRRNTDHSAMPTRTFDYRNPRFVPIAQFRKSEIDDLLLDSLALLVSRVEVFRDGERCDLVPSGRRRERFQWVDPRPSAAPVTSYFLKVTRIDHECAWTSPIWIQR